MKGICDASVQVCLEARNEALRLSQQPSHDAFPFLHYVLAAAINRFELREENDDDGDDDDQEDGGNGRKRR